MRYLIYFVESIPAGGKSTYSKDLFLKRRNTTQYFRENFKNPIDLLRQAMLSDSLYGDFIKRIENSCTQIEFRTIKKEIENNITKMDDKIFFPYLWLMSYNISDVSLFEELYNYEVDDGKIDYIQYTNIIYRRFEIFLKEIEKNKDYIFEGVLFHNPLITILGYYNCDFNTLRSFYTGLYGLLKMYEYQVVYIQVDKIEEAVAHAAGVRMDKFDYNWVNGFNRWFSDSKNFKDYVGVDGITRFAIKIKQYEELIISTIPFNREIVYRIA